MARVKRASTGGDEIVSETCVCVAVAVMLFMQCVEDDVQGMTRCPIFHQLPTDNAAGSVSDFTAQHLEPLRQTPSELDRFELTLHPGSFTGRRIRELGLFLAGRS